MRSSQNKPLGLKARFQLSRFFWGEPPVSGPVELTRRRVFILPTWRGLGMVLTIFLLLLVAFIYNNNLVYFLAFFMASIFFVAILHTYNALAGILVQAGEAKPVFLGELAAFTLVINNPGNQSRPALCASLQSEISFDLAGQESRRLMVYAASQRRGWQDMGRVTLATIFPLGLFRAWSPLRFDSRVLIYPAPCAQLVPFPLAGVCDAEGRLTLEKKGADDFSGVKSYQLGDSPRQIHWQAYAKGQGLFSKYYSSDVGNGDLWLVFDRTPGNNAEERLSQLCRWVLDAERSGMRYGLWLPNSKIEVSRGSQHQANCLKALALF